MVSWWDKLRSFHIFPLLLLQTTVLFQCSSVLLMSLIRLHVVPTMSISNLDSPPFSHTIKGIPEGVVADFLWFVGILSVFQRSLEFPTIWFSLFIYLFANWLFMVSCLLVCLTVCFRDHKQGSCNYMYLDGWANKQRKHQLCPAFNCLDHVRFGKLLQ